MMKRRPTNTSFDQKRNSSKPKIEQPPPASIPITYERPAYTYNDDKPEEHFDDLRAKKEEDEAFLRKVEANKARMLKERLRA